MSKLEKNKKTKTNKQTKKTAQVRPFWQGKIFITKPRVNHTTLNTKPT